MPMDVLQSIQNAQCDANSSIHWEPLLFTKNLAQQPAVKPFHDHIDLATVIICHHLHYARMVQLLADLLFAMKPVKQNRVALHFRMRDLDGDLPPCSQICAAENRRHATAGRDGLDTIMVELIARME